MLFTVMLARKRLFVILLPVLFFAMRCSSCAAITYWKTLKEEPAVQTDFIERNPWLLNKSRWMLLADTSQSKLPRSKLGAFSVGNGIVFTLLGLNNPMNTFHGMTGPTYSSPFFGDEWIEVRTNGEKIELPQQWIWRARGTDVVVTLEKNGDVALYTVNFAPPGMEALVRIIIVKNISGKTKKNVQVVCRLYGADGAGKQSELLQSRESRNLSAGFLDGKAYVEGDALIFPVGDMAGGSEKTSLHYISLNTNEKGKEKTINTLKKETFGLLSKTKHWWDAWLSDAMNIITPDEKVNDFFEGMAVSLKIQQMANGAQVPVVKYADRSHDRENVNIARFMLMMGKFSDVKEMIQFCYKAAIKNGEIINSQDILTDVAHLPPEPEWENVPVDNVNPHYHAAERPSWTLLQFYWYYMRTDDVALIRKVYPYLKRNLLGQEITSDGLLPFHGDEMYQIIFPMYVSRMPLQNMFSADSSFAFVAAAEGMKVIAARLGKMDDALLFQQLADRVRDAAENHYWLKDGNYYAPALRNDSKDAVKAFFADIGLKPAWTGYADGESGDSHDRAKENLLTHMNVLLRTDGTLKMAQNSPVYHGQVPGLFLYNLAYFDHPHAENAFNALDMIADPAGQFAEAHKSNHLPLAVNMDASGLKKEDARRLGPWEGSVNAYSAAYYLTGIVVNAAKNELSLSPRLPNGWDTLQVKNCHVGKTSVDFSVQDSGSGRTYSIINKGKDSVHVNLMLCFNKKVALREVRIGGVKVSEDSVTVDDEWGTTRIKNIKVKVMPLSKANIEIKYADK